MAPRAMARGATDDNDYIHFEDAHGGEHARRARQEYERIEAIHFSVPEGRGANARVPGERETDACERAVHPRRADAVARGRRVRVLTLERRSWDKGDCWNG